MSSYDNRLSVYYQNVRGLRTKTNEFIASLLNRDLDVIVLCETWLVEGIHSSELFDQRYIVYRIDRDLNLTHKLDGGGCLIAVKSNFCSSRIEEWENEREDLWISIVKSDNEKTFLNVKYIDCKCSLDQYNVHLKSIENIVNISSPNSHFLLIGDYNLADSITWSANSDGVCDASINQGCKDSEKKIIANTVLDMLSLTNLNQFNHIKNNLNRTLDLVLSNMDHSKITLFEDTDPLVRLDNQHPALLLKLDIKPLKFLPENRQPKLNFFRADYEELNRLIDSIDWTKELQHLYVDKATQRFYELIKVLLVNVPKVKFAKANFPCWYTSDLIKLIRTKSILKQQYNDKIKKGIADDSDYENFSNMRRKVKNFQERCHENYVADIEGKLSSNTKSFFSYTKSLKASNSLPNVVHHNGSSSSDRQSVCNMFASYFASVYQQPDHERINIRQVTADFKLSPISPEEVKVILEKLDQYKVSSPDNLPAIFFKKLARVISLPLSMLFNKSVTEGKYPDPWKESFITPVFKSGNRSNVNNYRPISILCAISKVFERIIFNQLYKHISDHISPVQHGFVFGRSTQTNLLEFIHFVVESMANGGQVDTIFTDFSKAFDQVSHNLLLQDLENFGVKGVLLNWFRSYLIGRSQFILIGSTKSTRVCPSSGIPQGSILGPLLFLIFINNLPSIFKKSKSSLYADDHKLSKKINDISDCVALQEDLDMLSKWCKDRLLNINEEKCYDLTTTYKLNKINYTYNINGKNTTKVSVKKDLGVDIDEKVKFDSHFRTVTRKCYQTIGFIFRSTKHFKNVKSILKLYYAYVRSRLDYCCSVWNPYYIKYIDAIERVQKKFTRMLYYKFNWIKVDYKNRLRELKMHSLETRRLQLDEILLHGIVNGRINTTLSSHIQFNQPSRFTRFPPTFYLPTVKSNYASNAPLYRILNNHNTIFPNVNICNTNQLGFKNFIRNFFEF